MSKITTLGFVIIVLVACTAGDTRSFEKVKLSQRGRHNFPRKRYSYVLSENFMNNVRVQSDIAIEKSRSESAKEVKVGLGTIIRIIEKVGSSDLPEKCHPRHELFRLNTRNYMRRMRDCIVQKFEDFTAFRKKKREVIDAAIKFIHEINDLQNMTELDRKNMNKLTISVKTLLNQAASVLSKLTSCASKKVIQNIVRIGKEFIESGC